ncbi:MAG: DNA internalization-related competence protein ComEC/Rec2 [Fuerstiella sp.]
MHLKVSLSWMLGLSLGYLADCAVAPLLWASLLLLLYSVLNLRFSSDSWRLAAVLMAVALAGTCRWELSQQPHQNQYAASNRQLEGTFTGTISSIPVVYRRPDSAWSISYGGSERTAFDLLVQLPANAVTQASTEVWHVSLDGNSRGRLSCGDVVSITGQAVRPAPASNPGQFDFRQQLQSRGIARLLFVNHFSAIQVVEQASWWNPYRWASWLRADAERILDTSLAGQDQQLAVAMFLGNRSQLPHELRDAFVASGTMHLLAISGLHVGILSLFVIRLFHVLGASRQKALLAMMFLICGYAMVTGFRPSVVRATLFLLLFGVSQLLGKQQRLLDLLSLTALIMTIWVPELFVDTGAWLSFLSIGALAWYSSQTNASQTNQDVPEDGRTIRQLIARGMRSLWRHTRQRYGQMLAILLFTLPLTTSEFHVMSAVSLLVNVLLISYTFFVLGTGYFTLLVAVLLPPAGWIPASLFSVLLGYFSSLVNWAAQLPFGHFYLADYPEWFLPAWYGALVAMVISRHPSIRRGFAVALCVIGMVGLAAAWDEPSDSALTVTVLDIGHGSAAVLECGKQVILIDSGSLNKGRQAAEIVSAYLWAQGWNHIDQVIISHADSDHYNAVPTLISRFPIGQIVTSKQFTQSTDEAVQSFIKLMRLRKIDLRIVGSGAGIPLAIGKLQILQPDISLLAANATDNETSLVVKVDLGDVSVLLPGDLEQRGLETLLPQLRKADVLVSPHHGSRFSNPETLADSVAPELVVVSARDASSRKHLERVYAASKAVWWTSEAGAIQLTLRAESLFVQAFRPSHHFPNGSAGGKR